MMREIKFRGLEVHSKTWRIGGIHINDDGKVFIIIGSYPNKSVGWAFVEVDPKTVCQFTEILDKDGKEIFGGDIIKMVYVHDEGGGWKSNSKEMGVVYFDQHWGVKFDCKDFTQRTADGWKLKGSKFQDACDVKVIGNIHENPELLDKAV